MINNSNLSPAKLWVSCSHMKAIYSIHSIWLVSPLVLPHHVCVCGGGGGGWGGEGGGRGIWTHPSSLENSNFLNLHKKLPKICHGPPPPWKIFLIHTWTAFFNYYAVLISYKNFNTFIRHLVSCIVGTFFSQNFTKSGGCALYLGTIKFQLIFLSPNMEFTDQVLTIMSTTNHVPNNAQFMLAYTIDILDILLCGHLYQH